MSTLKEQVEAQRAQLMQLEARAAVSWKKAIAS